MLNREEELRFCRARRGAIALDFQALNPEQRQAALATEGPLLLLAGAGSGKTTVLIHRIANLIRYGRGADSDEVPGWVTPADVDFLEAYRLDNCFVHLDTYHMNIEEADPYAAIRRCGARLGYFHVADNSRRYPGSGQLDFRRLLRTLQETGYSGWITVECIPDPDRGTAAQKAIRYLRGCEATL